MEASPLDAARADARWVRPPMERPRGTNFIARKKRRQKGSGACFVLGVRSEDPGKVVTDMEIVNTVVGTAEVELDCSLQAFGVFIRPEEMTRTPECLLIKHLLARFFFFFSGN